MVMAAILAIACGDPDLVLRQQVTKLEERLTALERRDATTEAAVRDITAAMTYVGLVRQDRALVAWYCGEARCFRREAECTAVLPDCQPRAFAYCSFAQLDPANPAVVPVDCSPTLAGCDARGVDQGRFCVFVR